MIKLPKVIWVVYKENDARNIIAFVSIELATEYIAEWEKKFPEDTDNLFIDEITLFDEQPKH